jgi:hypothetical protein
LESRDKSYSLQKTKDGYFIEISDDKLPSEIEYKFTKGGWENVEMDSEGHFTSNRKVKKQAKRLKILLKIGAELGSVQGRIFSQNRTDIRKLLYPATE